MSNIAEQKALEAYLVCDDEDYVSFETAKLLKEKGFDRPVRFEYHCIYNVNQKPQFHKKLHNFNGVEYNGLTSKWYSAPTHQMALKWLREVHKIFVEPFVAIDLNGKYHYSFRLLNSICKDILEPKDLRNDFKDTYEQAVEAALLYVLKNLI